MSRATVIVGGGPAGLAGAIALRRRGLAATVIDHRRPPIDKACGEGLMPDGVQWLESNGVRLAPGGSAEFRGIRYLDGERVAEACFPDGHGLGIRRRELHRALTARAEELDVRLEWGVRALSVGEHGVETTKGSLSADWIVGADGLASRVRSWAGLESGKRRRRSRRRIGVRRHFRLAPWTDKVEVYWADGCEAYVTPVSATETGVALLQTGDSRRFDEAIGDFPALRRRLRGAAVSSSDRGSGPLWRRPQAVRSGRVALLGDAAGYLDAITGEGLSLAFHGADALADAIAAGDLRLYERRLDQLVALPFALIRFLLFAERHPALRRRLIATLAVEHHLFERLLAIHARQRPVASLGLGGALRLVRGICSPRRPSRRHAEPSSRAPRFR